MQTHREKQSDDTLQIGVLVTDDDSGLRETLVMVLQREGYAVDAAESGEAALTIMGRKSYDLLITDVRMPGMGGLELLRRARAAYPKTLVIVMTAFDRREVAREAINAGAYDYFSKPLELADLRIVVRRATKHAEMQRQMEKLRQQAALNTMVGTGPAMQEVLRSVEKVLDNDITVLLHGESGTGKDLLAQYIHNNSARAGKPFIALNCAAIPETLLESELFGHERGAFTGATETHRGKFEAADGGTIFLDEIGDMPLTLQAKILRVLQEGEIVRVGANTPIKVNVRLITATHRNLKQMVEHGTFRNDLFYRLNVYPIVLPPLAQRTQDLPLLIDHFLTEANEQLKRAVEHFTPDAMRAMEKYAWPGNIRQLKNVVQRAVLVANGPVAGPETLPDEIRTCEPHPTQYANVEYDCEEMGKLMFPATQTADTTPMADLARLIRDTTLPLPRKVEMLTEVLEKQLLLQALEQCNGKRQTTADALGISRKTLHNKMKRYGITDDNEE